MRRSPSTPKLSASISCATKSPLARTQSRSRHQRRPHRLSKAQAPRLPLQLYSSRPLLCPPRSRPLRRRWPVVHDAVWFSRYGTLVSTIESFVSHSPSGWFADELADVLHADVQDPLHDLVRAERLRRSEVAGRFLYTSADGRQTRDQLRTRQTAESVPLLTDASALQVSPDELKAAILLFYSLLDEQQRRLFAGLESIKLGHGGDSVLAEFSAWTAHRRSRTPTTPRSECIDEPHAPFRWRTQTSRKKPPTSSP